MSILLSRVRMRKAQNSGAPPRPTPIFLIGSSFKSVVAHYRHWWRSYRHWWRSTGTGGAVPALVAQYWHWWRSTGTGGAVCKGATPSVEQPGGRGFKPRLRSLLD